jgi:hypothetical protein
MKPFYVRQREEEEEKKKKEQEIKDAAFDHGFVYINGDHVHLQDLQDHGHKHTRKPLKALPRQQPLSSGSLSSKPLSSSTYMVCTQAAGNGALVALPDFVEKLQRLETQVWNLQRLETQVSTLLQKIPDIDAMRDKIETMGHKLINFEQVLQFQHHQLQQVKGQMPPPTFQMLGPGELSGMSESNLRAYNRAYEEAKRNKYEFRPP